MLMLPIDLDVALAVALAPVQQSWTVDRCGSCGEQSIADVGGLEVCARQSQLFGDGPEFDEFHERDAAADAELIALCDPPTMVAVFEALRAALAENDARGEAINVLLATCTDHVSDEVRRAAVSAAESDRAREILGHLLPAPTLSLVT